MTRYRDVEIICYPVGGGKTTCEIREHGGKEIWKDITALEMVTKKADYFISNGFSFRANIKGEIECKKRGDVVVCKVFPDIPNR